MVDLVLYPEPLNQLQPLDQPGDTIAATYPEGVEFAGHTSTQAWDPHSTPAGENVHACPLNRQFDGVTHNEGGEARDTDPGFLRYCSDRPQQRDSINAGSIKQAVADPNRPKNPESSPARARSRSSPTLMAPNRIPR